MNITSEQHAAIHTHDRNLIVVAGAGSGKTFVLVERYLALLEKNPDWTLNQLVAVTFTQKAAQEMRDRVRSALSYHASTAQGEAATLWASRLAAMDSARIDTIHALCASILRANAAEAKIDPRFSVLEDIEATILLENAIDDALRDLTLKNSEALVLFEHYEADEIRRALSKLISTDIQLDDDPFETWTQQWQTNAEVLLNQLLTDSEFNAAASWTPPGGFPSGTNRILDVWLACPPLIQQIRAPNPIENRIEALKTLRKTLNLTGGSPNFWGGKAAFDEAKAPLKWMQTRLDNLIKAIGTPPGEHDRRAAALLPHWATLVRHAQEAYQRAKAERGALDFDDLERRTAALLREHPEVCARYKNAEFKHLLVDEFQDTNSTQWEIISALADPIQPGSLFLVGDAKQSIYAFRGADVTVFEEMRATLSGNGGRELPLARSFRTHKPLVDDFNRLFQKLLRRDTGAAYEIEFGEPMDAQRESSPTTNTPHIELLLVNKASIQDDADEGKAERCRREEARAIARRLQAMIEAGLPVFDRKKGERALEWGDVALLFQSMNQVTIYEDEFKRAGLPFVTIAGRGYYDRQEVWDLLNLLRALHNPADTLALASALRSPLFNLSDDALLALRVQGDPLWEALSQPAPLLPADEIERVAFARETLMELRRLAGRVTISELLAEALEKTGYLAVLTGLPDGDRRRSNVEKLLEKAHSSGKITLSAFSQYLTDLSDREVREGEAALNVDNAVKLMTVHKSKGLEFPVVVMADCSWERRGGGNPPALLGQPFVCKVYDETTGEWAKPFVYTQAEQEEKRRETAESRRKLYVAATRAQDYLIISGTIEIGKKDGKLTGGGWMRWLLDAFELCDLPPEGEHVLQDWGNVRVSFVQVTEQPLVSAAAQARNEPSPALMPAADEMPPMVQPLALDQQAALRSLKATQLADIGSALHATPVHRRAAYRARWRREALYDAPARVETVSQARKSHFNRHVGKMVHRMLHVWRRGMSEADIRHMLHGYAWDEGVVEPEAQQRLVDAAYRLLGWVLRSDVHRWIAEAAEVHRELPFSHLTKDNRIVHGRIDVLLRTKRGDWRIIDYKTTWVNKAEKPEHHAQRYHLQVGIYAEAVEEMVKATPEIYIYYIQHGFTVRIETQHWRAALDELNHSMTLLTEDAE
jgi:ATP-dependent helicase/nuclease subunit A